MQGHSITAGMEASPTGLMNHTNSHPCLCSSAICKAARPLVRLQFLLSAKSAMHRWKAAERELAGEVSMSGMLGDNHTGGGTLGFD